MSIVRRMKEMTKATFNEMLEKAENPVQSIEQYLTEQKRSLYELEQLYKDQLQHACQVRAQLKEAIQLAEKRDQQAELAIRAGEEELAKIALEDKLKQLDKATRYEMLAKQSKDTTEELEERMNEVKEDIQEVSDQKQFYADRMESVRLQQQMNERRHGSSARSYSWFDRLEDLVQELEFETRAYRDVKNFNIHRSEQAEASHSKLDDELEKLKKKIDEQGGGLT